MTNRLYEGLFLFDANETAKGWSEVESMVNTLLEKHGASLEYTERWADQRLAYEIKGVRKGTYFLTYFRTDSQNIEPLRSDAALNERILRVLFIQEDWLEDEMNRRKENASKPRPAPTPEDESSDEEGSDAMQGDEAQAEAPVGAGEESQD